MRTGFLFFGQEGISINMSKKPNMNSTFVYVLKGGMK